MPLNDMMYNKTRRILRHLLCAAMVLCWAPAALGAELSMPAVQGKTGQDIEIPVVIDLAEKLAGVKLVLEYDPEILSYSTATKTRQTSSLLHVINSKTPGVLIIVMAGARGISGKDFPLLDITMTPKKDISQSGDLLRIIEAQLMNDQLQEIKCTIKKNIAAAPEAAKKPLAPPQPSTR